MAGPDLNEPGSWTARIGQRVVVRHRLPDGSATDVVGLLERAGTTLSVRADRGLVEVPLVDILAGKVVPPRATRAAPPHRALSIADLETVMAEHWQAVDRERLGRWLLRASGGFTGRANSVLAVGDPGLPLPDAVAAVRAWYATRHLPPMASVAEPVDDRPDASRDVRTAFAANGWAVRDGGSGLVLTAPTAELRASGQVPENLTMYLADEPDAAWLAIYRYRGQNFPPHATALLVSAPAQVFASVRDGAATVAVARGSFGGGWAGVTAVDVDPAYRRRGLARSLLAALADWGWHRGALSTYLQVAETNVPAQRLYLGAGFAVHHRYDYLVAPA